MDIFPVMFEDTKEDGMKTRFESDEANSEWSKCFFKMTELFPLKEYKFGSGVILGPKNPRPYLNKCYGPSWRKVGYITMADHYLLDEPIKVKVTKFVPADKQYVPKSQIHLPKNHPLLLGYGNLC